MFSLKVSIFAGNEAKTVLSLLKDNGIKISSIENQCIELSNSTTIEQLELIESFFELEFLPVTTLMQEHYLSIDLRD